MVLQGRPIGISYQNDDSTLDICETLAFSTKMPFIIKENEVDDIHTNRNDYAEG